MLGGIFPKLSLMQDKYRSANMKYLLSICLSLEAIIMTQLMVTANNLSGLLMLVVDTFEVSLKHRDSLLKTLNLIIL